MPSQSTELDDVFQALSHPARRDVVRRLSTGAAAVSELAEPFDMALPSFLQHLQVLEACGLVDSEKVGRVRTYRLTPTPLRAARGWLDEQKAIWERRLDQLDDYVLDLRQWETGQ
jgi:DNA-binding transcriptional ArsR family regulator